MSHFPYRFFNNYIVRTPMFSWKRWKEIIDKTVISDTELKKIFTDPVFQEALYLASPYLYDELKQWQFSEKYFSPKENYRLKNTLLKYYNRISLRSTPFGVVCCSWSREFQ